MTNLDDSRKRLEKVGVDQVENVQRINVTIGHSASKLDGFYNPGVNHIIFPGVTKTGNVFFIAESTPWEDIRDGIALLYEVQAPYEELPGDLEAEPYTFELQLEPPD